MTSEDTKKHNFDLEERCRLFAKRCRDLSKQLSNSIENIEYRKQLIRSSGSVGANYIEANECLSKKDFAHRIKISRKEARETQHWLELLDIENNFELDKERNTLQNEAVELMKICAAIYQKSK